MKTLLCPKCGYGIDKHGDAPELGFYDAEASTMGVFYPCPLSKIDMLLAAQRAEAIEHLKGLAVFVRIEIETTGEPMSDDWEKLLAVVDAYSAIGVLNSPKDNRHA